MKKVLSYSVSIISALIFIGSIYIIVGSTLALRNQELFRIFGYSYAVVPTSSMEGDNPDSLNAGDAVVIYHTPYENLEIGDVIVYQSSTDNRMIIHRIVNETDEGFITKGDNNPSADTQIVTKDSYMGKYSSHFSFFGIGLWLTDFRIILLGGLSILLFVVILYQIFKMIWQYKSAKLEETIKTRNADMKDQDYEG